MKAKVILSALALPALFAACTNEDLEFAKQGNELPKDLVELNNPTFTVVSGDNQGATTRMTTDGKWEASDEVGVGFINWWTSGSGSNQYATGTRHPAENGWANAITEGKLYANHRLFLNDGAWKFETVVYEGLHYAYYPLNGSHTSVAPLEVTLGETQEAGKEDEFITKGLFAVSPLYDLENDQAGKAPKVNLTLNTISNRLGLDLQLANANGITDPIIIKNVTVKAQSGTGTFSDEDIFAQTATVLGGNLPTAIYTKQLVWEALPNGDASKTEAKLAEAIAEDAKSTVTAFNTSLISGAALDYTTHARTASIATAVKGHAGLTSSVKNYNVNLFTFPVDATTPVTKVIVAVDTNYGTITIESGATAGNDQNIKDNNTKLANLIKVLNGGTDAPLVDGKALKFTEFGKLATMPLKLDMKGAVLTEISVANDAEWAEAMKIADKVAKVTTINVTDNVTASLTNLPANVATINVAKTLTVSGDITNNLTIAQSAANAKVKVAAETALSIKGEMLDKTTATFDITLDNFGTVNVDQNSTLSASVTNGVINNHGEVVNSGTLNLLALFTNCKDVKGQGSPKADHTCTGILRNNNAITGSASMLTNNGTLYQAGTITTVTFNSPGTGSKAISVDGGDLPTDCAASKEANVESTKQFNAALTAGATTINAKGIIALSTTLSEELQLNLQDGAEFYIQEGAANTPTKKFSVTAESGNCLIKSAASVYLDIENLAAVPAAVLTIGTAGDSYAKKTAINVMSLSYPKGAKIINNGWVYAEKGSSTNTGIWEGLDANKKQKAADDSEEIAIANKLSASDR